MARVSRANAQASAIVASSPPRFCEATEDRDDPTDPPKRKRGRPRKIPLEPLLSPLTSVSPAVDLSENIVKSDLESTPTPVKDINLGLDPTSAPVKDNNDESPVPALADNLARVLQSVSRALPPPAAHPDPVAATPPSIPSAPTPAPTKSPATPATPATPTTPAATPATATLTPAPTQSSATPTTPAIAAPTPASSHPTPVEDVSRSPTVERDWSSDSNFMVARDSVESETVVVQQQPSYVVAVPTISSRVEHLPAPTSSSSQPSYYQRKQRSSAILWSPEMIDALMMSAVKNIREGKRKATGLPRETWADIARDVAYASPGHKRQHITWEKCQTKMESLRKKWKLHCRLMKTPGFSKCPRTGAVVGPEHLWLEEQKKDPKVREFRIHPPTNVPELAIVFDNLREYDLPGPISMTHAKPSPAVLAPSPATNTNNIATPNMINHQNKRKDSDHDPPIPAKRVATDASLQRDIYAANRLPINGVELNNLNQAPERAEQAQVALEGVHVQQQYSSGSNTPQPNMPTPNMPQRSDSPRKIAQHNIPPQNITPQHMPHNMPLQAPQMPYPHGPGHTNMPPTPQILYGYGPGQNMSHAHMGPHAYGPNMSPHNMAPQTPQMPYPHGSNMSQQPSQMQFGYPPNMPYVYGTGPNILQQPPSTPIQAPAPATALQPTEAAASVLERASAQLMKNFKYRCGWSRLNTMKALEMLEQSRKADIFVGLSGDVDMQDDWLRMQLGMEVRTENSKS
ncbi:Protein of unknown function [Pyronema omphalodes CBS 100304]|uniref:Myb/SANT-like domain-containing protein n=1 Tax=Pyronema omphalodes (strain CBS 100304) TaxID=1076935 RepID=U4LSW2_PYROM|nr:Protein of unknown function [Pyronema omphalodes CBS 100304]